MSAAATTDADEPDASGHWKSLTDSPYIRYADLKGRDVSLQIKKIKKGKVVGIGAKTERKVLIWFEGSSDKKLIAVPTIMSQIAALHGVNVESWVGKWITIWPDPSVTYGKERCGGVRVRPVVPKASAAAQLVTAENVAESRKQIDAAEAAEKGATNG